MTKSILIGLFVFNQNTQENKQYTKDSLPSVLERPIDL